MESLQKIIKQAEMQKLQLEVQTRFLKNLDIFKQRFPAIADKFNDRKPTEISLKLDHNEELNLYHAPSNTFRYSDSPKEYCHQQVELFNNSPRISRLRISSGEEMNKKHIHMRKLNALLNSYDELKIKKAYQNQKHITNLTITSIGIGYFLPKLINEHNIYNLFVYENNLDIFQATLYTIDWSHILEEFSKPGKSITFCLGVEPSSALQQIETTISKTGLHNHIYTHIYRHTTSKKEEEFINYYFAEIYNVASALGYFDDEQTSLAHTVVNLESKHAVFLSNKKKDTSYLPTALIVANGPSLDRHEQYIKDNKEGCIIISCGTAFGSLYKMGIVPDFHVQNERSWDTKDMLDFSTDLETRKKVRLLCLNSVPPAMLDDFKEACYAKKLNDVAEQIIDNYFAPQDIDNLPFSNPTVANTGVSFAINMGFQKIQLIGCDLGMPTSDEHHSKYSPHFDLDDSPDDDTHSAFYAYADEKIEIPGNFGGTVISHKILNLSRQAMERLFYAKHLLHPHFTCLNSAEGAYIDETVPTKIEDLPFHPKLDKLIVIDELVKICFYRKNKKNKNPKEKVLDYLFSIKSHILLPEKIENPEQLFIECQRIYETLSKENDNVTHFLLRGSVNLFFGAITQYCSYLAIPSEFKQHVKIGIEHYNDFINLVYEKMEDSPYSEDDSYHDLIREKAAESIN